MLFQPHPRGAFFKFKIMTQKPLTIAEFEVLPAEQQRILIAQDVIANIKAEILMAATGNYIQLPWELKNEENEGLDVREYFDLFEKEGKGECEVCALGACLISTTKFRNQLTFHDLDDAGTGDGSQVAFSLLKGIFSPKQLLLMEDAFEGVVDYDSERNWEQILRERLSLRVAINVFDYNHPEEERLDLYKRCQAFYDMYENDDDERLIAIMENIIANSGEFIP
jgi:hypothetical protein